SEYRRVGFPHRLHARQPLYVLSTQIHTRTMGSTIILAAIMHARRSLSPSTVNTDTSATWTWSTIILIAVLAAAMIDAVYYRIKRAGLAGPIEWPLIGAIPWVIAERKAVLQAALRYMRQVRAWSTKRWLRFIVRDTAHGSPLLVHSSAS